VSLEPGLGLHACTMTTTDGRALRYVQAGEGETVVVFEAGLGACASEWVTVQRMVSTAARTVSYDRAGHAGSSPDPQPRSLDRICQDLHALIEKVAPAAPVVLVAHSYGGPIVRCYSEQHPERVAGVVLVDATLSATLPPVAAKATARMMPLLHLLHRLGVGRVLMKRKVQLRPSADLHEADLEIIERDLFSRRSALASVAEARALPASVPLMRRWEGAGLPAVPVMSVVATGLSRGDQKRREATMITPYQQEMARHQYVECRVVAGGHFVPQDHPRLTADAVLDVVAAVRGT
jgi:pimeloyl-ACP methyl ester carboxylesterase